MNQKPPVSIRANHRLQNLLPVLNLYDSLEVVVNQSGRESIGVFLTPNDALYLAERLIELARKKLEASA